MFKKRLLKEVKRELMSSEQKSKRKNNTIETKARLVPACKCTHTHAESGI